MYYFYLFYIHIGVSGRHNQGPDYIQLHLKARVYESNDLPLSTSSLTSFTKDNHSGYKSEAVICSHIFCHVSPTHAQVSPIACRVHH
ncbi:hypothetical protein TSMEX_009424 [Taenia solium]|eukprot:TsM_000158100 transcript=TsM_000158100 gene=TsM_000158100